MDTPSEKYKPDYGNRSGPFLAMMQSIHGLILNLTGIFKVTGEDFSDAGIFHGGERRD